MLDEEVLIHQGQISWVQYSELVFLLFHGSESQVLTCSVHVLMRQILQTKIPHSMNVVLAILEWRSCCFKKSSFEKTGRWDTKHCSEVLNLYFIFYTCICKLLKHLHVSLLHVLMVLCNQSWEIQNTVRDKAALAMLDDTNIRSYWHVNTSRNHFIKMSFNMAVVTSHEKYNATCCKFVLPWLLGWDVKLSFI